MKQAILKITGRVQGVFFRTNAQEQAQALSLTGYAKNMPDGSVEIFVQGKEENIKKFIEWCRQGPKSAKVTDVEIHWQTPEEITEDFSTF